MPYVPVTHKKKTGPKPSGNTAQVSAWISPVVATFIDQQAAKRGVKRSVIVRRAMDAYYVNEVTDFPYVRRAPKPAPRSAILIARIKRSLGL